MLYLPVLRLVARGFMNKKRFLLFFSFFLLSFSLTACGGVEEHIWLKSLGWSRAVYLGSTAYKEPVPVVLNDAGEQFFLLTEKDGNSNNAYFRLKAYSQDADLLWDTSLTEIALHAPEAAHLYWLDGELRLFWIEEQQLYTLSLDSSGNLLGDPILLSEEDTVDSLSLVTDSTGAATLFYAGTRKEPGVYALSSFDGTPAKTTLDPAGIRIQARVDQDDILHLGWARYPPGYGTSEIVYAAYPSQSAWDDENLHVIHSLATSPANLLDGPVLGVDTNDIYIFWTVTIRSGLESGTVTTEYLSFPHNTLAAVEQPQTLTMPAISTSMRQEFFPAEQLKAGERVDLRSPLPVTADVQELTTNTNVAGELGLAFQTPTQHLWRKSKYQVNVAYFADGVPTSYQPLSYTTTLSTTPYLANGADGYVYITWLEKLESDRYTVYYASTAPQWVTVLGRSTSDEILRVVGQVLFGMLVGVLMAPIAGAVWMLAPLFVLLLLAPLRKLGSERIRLWLSILSLVIAVAAYWVGKLAVLPGMSTYVPFSAWVPEISLGLSAFLRWFVPLGFSLFALLVAWHYTFRQSSDSTLYFLLIYIGIDALLTSSVYAVLIFGGI